MKTPTLTKVIICACWSIAAFFSAGFLTSSFAGPERMSDTGKDKQVEMVQPEPEQKWYVSIGIGTDFDTEETDFVNGLELFFPVGDMGGLNIPGLDDIVGRVGRSFNGNGPIILEGVELNIKQRNWDDVYWNAYRVEAEFGRRLGNHLELFGRFNYVHACGSTTTGSNITLVFTAFDFVIPFETKFSDYNSYGGELGARYVFLQPEAAIRPYVSLAGGGTFTEAIHAHTWGNFLGQNFDIYDDNFYEDSFVGTGAAMFGFQSRVTRRFSVGVEAGIRYESTLCGADIFENVFGDSMLPSVASARPAGASSTINKLRNGLNSINDDAGDRLTIPLIFWATYRF